MIRTQILRCTLPKATADALNQESGLPAQRSLAVGADEPHRNARTGYESAHWDARNVPAHRDAKHVSAHRDAGYVWIGLSNAIPDSPAWWRLRAYAVGQSWMVFSETSLVVVSFFSTNSLTHLTFKR